MAKREGGSLIDRYLEYAKNDVIHYDDIKDPALKAMLLNKKTLGYIRRELSKIRPSLDVYLPKERGLSHNIRKLQMIYGTEINLSVVKAEQPKIYSAITSRARLNESLKAHGITVSHDKRVWNDDETLEVLKRYIVSDNIVVIPYGSEHYVSMRNKAHERGISCKEFCAGFGLEWRTATEHKLIEKEKENARSNKSNSEGEGLPQTENGQV